MRNRLISIEDLLACCIIGMREDGAKRGVQGIAVLKVADLVEQPIDLRVDSLNVFRFGVGDPFEEIADLVVAFAGW
jgi:hypothetical protein